MTGPVHEGLEKGTQCRNRKSVVLNLGWQKGRALEPSACCCGAGKVRRSKGQ